MVDDGKSGNMIVGLEQFWKTEFSDENTLNAIPCINDIDVDQHWHQFQNQSFGVHEHINHASKTDRVQPSQNKATAEVYTAASGAVVAGQSVPIVESEFLPKEPSAHYKNKKKIEEGKLPSEGKDAYHDDDDPGYRIREIFEPELLAEISKHAAGRSPLGVASSAVQNPAGGAINNLQPNTSEPLSKAATPSTVDGASVVADTRAASELSVQAQGDGASDGNCSSSPTLIGTDAAQKELSEKKLKVEMEQQAGSGLQVAKSAHREYRQNVKYAESGDSFYPIQLDGAVFDSFALRVVFERHKTGFEESKEFPIRINSVVAARYQIVEYLGSAAFSRAVQCVDLQNKKMVCMKIIKNDKDFFDQSLDEIKLLKYINVNGDVDEHCVLRLYDYFYHKEHLIIVTELLRDNLYEFSKFNRDFGEAPYFTLGRLQKIAKQVLKGLDYAHSLGLIHCDLKPENILIKSFRRSEVKVIDFGSSCFVNDHLSSYVQSRSYRAPEVILGFAYDQKIDLWSVGCILAELWTGYVLFQNDSVHSLLARILGIIGNFPKHILARGRYVSQYFTQDGQLYMEVDGTTSPEKGRRLHIFVPKKTSLRERLRTDSDDFLNFLETLFSLDPAKRPTAAEALQHPWLTKCEYSDGG
eukprot:TRINITY_DN10349_c0_g2_i1.p1 TRINITY_DN10349_c0_g2~~TRINITY_DN10349_c0_g2_i1.p1  ORF type:complete len:741 (+),score=111.87 TRINITY_DN10349_c0_g2_i1:305-2224(+)